MTIKSSIKDMFQPKCIHRHTARTHPKCFDAEGKPLILREELNKESKVLIFDVETLPLVAYAWRVWQENIADSQIIKDWCIVSWSAKWLNDDRILSDVLTSKEAIARNDKRLLSSFWKLIDDADVIVAHNGKRFDIKKVNTRFWKHKMGKPSSYKVIDTLSSAKSVFSLNHNSQNSIARFLEIQEKLDTDFSLWAACDRGEPQALTYMLEYNEQDVRMLEEIYLDMREWIPGHPDLRLYRSYKDGCPVCLHNDYDNIGYYAADTRRYVEHRCKKCGSIWHDSKAVKE